MKMKFVKLIISCVLLLVIVQTSSAETTIGLTASKDVWIEDSFNKNNNDFIVIGKYKDYNKKRSLLQFELSRIPSNAKIKKAFINLYYYGYECHDNGRLEPTEAKIHQVLKQWDENSATKSKSTSLEKWDEAFLRIGTDTMPKPESVVNISTDAGFKSFDVTSLVQKWVSKKEPNYGILIWTPAEEKDGCDIRFYSREHSDVQNIPRLFITYAGEACSSNTGCGVDSYIDDYFCLEGNVYRKYIIYTCHNVGTLSSYCGESIKPKLVNECKEYEICVESKKECQLSGEETIELAADGDVWIQDRWCNFLVNTNYRDIFIVGKKILSEKKRSLVKFDISTLPIGTQIVSAVMKLYHSGASCLGGGKIGPINVQVHQVLYEWDETKATENKRTHTKEWSSEYLGLGTDAEAVPETFVNIGTIDGFKNFDVTSLAQKWVNGQAPNYGVLLWTPDETKDNCDRRFFSREYSDPSRRPKLVVTYTPAKQKNQSAAIS